MTLSIEGFFPVSFVQVKKCDFIQNENASNSTKGQIISTSHCKVESGHFVSVHSHVILVGHNGAQVT